MSIQTVDSQVSFNDFVKVVEKISNTASKEKKQDIFKKFFSRWREKHKQLHGEEKTSDSLYPVIRIILPHLDKDRSYGLKEIFLAKYYIEVLNISKKSTDGINLLRYKTPKLGKQGAGDFASVVYAALKNRCPDKGRFTIADVNECLDIIASANSEKRRDLVKNEIKKMIQNCCALEQKWIIRILLKEIRLGMSENTILPLFHPDALELYNISNSLHKVCLDLHDQNITLNKKNIMLMSPFRPMLGMRSTIDNIVKVLKHSEFFIETKIDGERIQLHKNGEQYAYFSRNAYDYSEIFGCTKYSGTLTQYINMLFKTDIKTCILDGEMVVYCVETNSFMLKGSNVDVKAQLPSGLQPCFVVFDVLMINDIELANISLKDRISKLVSIFDVMPGRIEVVDRKIGRNKEDIINAVNNAIDKCEEGIVVKDPLSLYVPNKRNGSGWYKLKPEYIDSLSDDLDLIIIGGQYGSGHRGGIISHFLLGVAVKTEEGSDTKPSYFKTFAAVGSGYTDKELSSLCSKLDKYWQKFDLKRLPSMIEFTSGCKEKPDVWIEPDKSVIVQVKAAEIIVTDKYAFGYTLRFPRLERFRYDKSWYDCMTTEDIIDLQKAACGKLTSKHIESESSTTSNKKKRRLDDHVDFPVAIGKQFKAADVSNINESSSAFKGKEFCVINGSLTCTKQQLEEKIAEMSGVFVQNPGEDTYCVIADKVNVRVKHIIGSGKCDVVKVTWLLECYEKKALLPFCPKYMHYSTTKTLALLEVDFDKFGDHYLEDINPSTLSDIFSHMNADNLNAENIAELDERYTISSVGLFRRHKLYLASKLHSFVSLEFRFYGGTLCNQLNVASHVLVDESDPETLVNIRQLIRNLKKKPHVVTASWIRDCIDFKRLIAEGPYEPK
ncbi:DNA ligase 4 isoform X1 [Hydra vulgaris]|uniref:DNA ligase 4 n=1 Tax=Hydra vulgaris TaxID=6087 RepID=T2MFF1_HYDVU|nr:DNA ligase 4 [Hydra vulgaris]